MVLLPALVRAGVEVEALIYVGCSSPDIERCLALLQGKGVRITRIDLSSRRRLMRAARLLTTLYRALRQRRNRIIHLHLDPYYRPVVAAAAGCRKVVFTIHSDEPVYASFSHRLWFKLLGRMVTHFIAISDRIRNYVTTRSSLPVARVTTVRYGLPQPDRPTNRVELRKQFGLPDQAVVVGFVGRLTRQKNVGAIFRAAAEISAVHVAVVGGGEEEEALRHLANRVCPGRVHFIGPHPHAAELMPMFDALCLPSLWEGLGLVTIEAMLRGVPVVGSRAGAIPEMLGGGEYGWLFDPTDHAELAAILRELVAQPERALAIADRAAAYARRTFTPDTMAEATLGVYRAVLRGSATG